MKFLFRIHAEKNLHTHVDKNAGMAGAPQPYWLSDRMVSVSSVPAMLPPDVPGHRGKTDRRRLR